MIVRATRVPVSWLFRKKCSAKCLAEKRKTLQKNNSTLIFCFYLSRSKVAGQRRHCVAKGASESQSFGHVALEDVAAIGDCAVARVVFLRAYVCI